MAYHGPPDPADYVLVRTADLRQIEEDWDGLAGYSAIWQTLAFTLGATAAGTVVAAVSVRGGAWFTATNLSIVAGGLTGMTGLCTAFHISTKRQENRSARFRAAVQRALPDLGERRP